MWDLQKANEKAKQEAETHTHKLDTQLCWAHQLQEANKELQKVAGKFQHQEAKCKWEQRGNVWKCVNFGACHETVSCSFG
jgi:dsDNA-specific endonuclease/ATPase MutS2